MCVNNQINQLIKMSGFVSLVRVVFVSCFYVCVVLELMALSLFVLAMCSSVPATLFPCNMPSCLIESSFVVTCSSCSLLPC